MNTALSNKYKRKFENILEDFKNDADIEALNEDLKDLSVPS